MAAHGRFKSTAGANHTGTDYNDFFLCQSGAHVTLPFTRRLQ